MRKEKLYQQIQIFNNQLTNPSDRSSKSYEKAYLYVDDKNAEDKAQFINYLIKNRYLKKKYSKIIDLTFGSGNLTSHIVFDNEIEYEELIFNDIENTKTNQNIINYIENANIQNDDILNINNFEDIEADLVIINPQIGGNYIDGDILKQKEDGEKEQDIYDKVSELLNRFLEKKAILLFYGQEKDFKSILSNCNYIKYNSKLRDIFVVNGQLEESLCFEKDKNNFILCKGNTKGDDKLESFDDIEIDTFESNNNKELKEKNKAIKKQKETEIFIANAIKYNFLHKNLLLKGVPGTGKSHTLEQIIENHLNLKDKPKNICHINIHSASSNADLMQGIGINSNDGQIEYKEKQGLIYNHIKKALFTPNQPFVLILEEIQENSLNELIGDLIYLIEVKKRVTVDPTQFEDGKEYGYQEFIEKVLEDKDNKHSIQIPYLVDTSTDYRKMVLPSNLYIFCTSNYRDDKKVIEDNLLRRFDVVEVYPKYKGVLKSDDMAKFLEKLNKEILEQFKREMHPDRYLVGHANWLDITDADNDKNKKLFYTALLKVIIEFKEIREVDFDAYVKPILKKLFKNDEHLSTRIEKYLNDCNFDLKSDKYKEIVEKLQSKIYSFL